MSPEKIDAHIMQCPYFGGKDTINRKKLVANTSMLETVHWSGIIGRYARVTLVCAQKRLGWEGEPMSNPNRKECSYGELRLTDEFKRSVVNMLMGETE